MSFDLFANGGKTIAVSEWLHCVRELGAEVELHPSVEVVAHSGWLPTRLVVTSTANFPLLLPFRRAGALHAGFEFDLEVGPDAPAKMIAIKRAKLERDLEVMEQKLAPEILLERWRERIANVSTEQQATFRTPMGRSGAECVAQVLCAAGFALASQGALEDPQGSDPPAFGEVAIRNMVTRILADFLGYGDIQIGHPFDVWGD